MSEPVSEFELIEKLKTKLQRPGRTRSPRILKGLGDDAAVLSAGSKQTLFCSDLMIESVHFDLKFITPYELGHKALASCFSDLVAMNGTGLAATVSLALPPNVTPEFVEAFYEGLDTFALKAGIECVGGDLSFSPHGLFIDVACLGESEKPIYRSGASLGDLLIVSGTPGASAAGLSELQSIGSTSPLLRQKHLTPLPRFDLQSSLSVMTSLIDISDGLASEAHHLAKASSVGLELEASKIPIHLDSLHAAKKLFPDANRAAQKALDWALFGGEDYELLATLPTHERVPDGFTVIGRVIEGPEVILVQSSGNKIRLSPRGFDHFRR